MCKGLTVKRDEGTLWGDGNVIVIEVHAFVKLFTCALKTSICCRSIISQERFKNFPIHLIYICLPALSFASGVEGSLPKVGYLVLFSLCPSNSFSSHISAVSDCDSSMICPQTHGSRERVKFHMADTAIICYWYPMRGR